MSKSDKLHKLLVILRSVSDEESFRLCRFSGKDPSLTLRMTGGSVNDDKIIVQNHE